MPRLYLSGPMRGYEEFNYPAFHYAAFNLRAKGYEVLNPAESFDGDTTLPFEVYMEEDKRLVAKADAVALLEGWEKSEGAAIEMETARLRGIPCYLLSDIYKLEDPGDLHKLAEVKPCGN